MTLSVVSFEMKTKAIQLTVSTLAVSFRSVRAKQEVQVQHVRVVTALATRSGCQCALAVNLNLRSDPHVEPYFFSCLCLWLPYCTAVYQAGSFQICTVLSSISSL